MQIPPRSRPYQNVPRYTLDRFDNSYTATQPCRVLVQSRQQERRQHVAKTELSTLDWATNTFIAKSLPNTINATLWTNLRSPRQPRTVKRARSASIQSHDINAKKKRCVSTLDYLPRHSPTTAPLETIRIMLWMDGWRVIQPCSHPDYPFNPYNQNGVNT